jgi:hypothetical protein
MSLRQPNRTKPSRIKPDGIKPIGAARIGAAIIGPALIAALVPEFHRYRSERRLYRASALFCSFIAESNAAAREPATLDAVDPVVSWR